MAAHGNTGMPEPAGPSPVGQRPHYDERNISRPGYLSGITLYPSDLPGLGLNPAKRPAEFRELITEAVRIARAHPTNTSGIALSIKCTDLAAPTAQDMHGPAARRLPQETTERRTRHSVHG